MIVKPHLPWEDTGCKPALNRHLYCRGSQGQGGILRALPSKRGVVYSAQFEDEFQHRASRKINCILETDTANFATGCFVKLVLELENCPGIERHEIHRERETRPGKEDRSKQVELGDDIR